MKKRDSNSSFTLMEIIIVIIILGIFSTMAITQYASYRENVLNREAQANLRLIVSGQRIHMMEMGNYVLVNPADNAAINSQLRLSLNNNNDRPWDYSTGQIGSSNVVCAQAVRVGPTAPNPATTWSMRNTDENPVRDSACAF